MWLKGYQERYKNEKKVPFPGGEEEIETWVLSAFFTGTKDEVQEMLDEFLENNKMDFGWVTKTEITNMEKFKKYVKKQGLKKRQRKKKK